LTDAVRFEVRSNKVVGKSKQSDHIEQARKTLGIEVDESEYKRPVVKSEGSTIWFVFWRSMNTAEINWSSVHAFAKMIGIELEAWEVLTLYAMFVAKVEAMNG
jgi:hypothetical protein